jgi:hypothetical protein
MYLHITTENEPPSDRSVNTVFERFAKLEQILRRGKFTEGHVVEYHQLDELLSDVVFIVDCERRRYLRCKIN